MFFEVNVKVVVMDKKGNDKNIVERIIAQDCTFFAEAEAKTLEHYNSECEVAAIKISNVKEFVNTRCKDEDSIFYATIEDMFYDEQSGEEKSTKYVVALFAENFDEATHLTKEYMKMGLQSMSLVAIKKTKVIDLI